MTSHNTTMMHNSTRRFRAPSPSTRWHKYLGSAAGRAVESASLKPSTEGVVRRRLLALSPPASPRPSTREPPRASRQSAAPRRLRRALCPPRSAFRGAGPAMASPLACGAIFCANALAMGYLGPRGVPARDVAFALGGAAYAALANAVSDKPLPGTVTRRAGTVSARRTVRLLFPFTLLLSIGAPWALLLGDPAAGALLAPSLFLVHAQLAAEALTFAFRDRVSLYVRITLPIAFVSYRVDTFWKLLHVVWTTDVPRVRLLRGLAFFNFVFWLFSLVGFLLPRVVPRSLHYPEDVFYSPKEDRNGKGMKLQ